MIAVCLLTADRRPYTERTLSSFAAHNDRSRFLLLHGDDASVDPDVPMLARDYGFQTVVQTETRIGWLEMRRAVFAEAARRKASWLLLLENDIEWVRAFPWALFDLIQRQPHLYCLRLFGAYKGLGVDPCMTYHKADRRRPVKWKPIKRAPEPAEVGYIHWSAQPCVARTADVLRLHRYGLESRSLTARVVENVTRHIGAERTAPALREAVA